MPASWHEELALHYAKILPGLHGSHLARLQYLLVSWYRLAAWLWCSWSVLYRPKLITPMNAEKPTQIEADKLQAHQDVCIKIHWDVIAWRCWTAMELRQEIGHLSCGVPIKRHIGVVLTSNAFLLPQIPIWCYIWETVISSSGRKMEMLLMVQTSQLCSKNTTEWPKRRATMYHFWFCNCILSPLGCTGQCQHRAQSIKSDRAALDINTQFPSIWHFDMGCYFVPEITQIASYQRNRRMKPGFSLECTISLPPHERTQISLLWRCPCPDPLYPMTKVFLLRKVILGFC